MVWLLALLALVLAEDCKKNQCRRNVGPQLLQFTSRILAALASKQLRCEAFGRHRTAPRHPATHHPVGHSSMA